MGFIKASSAKFLVFLTVSRAFGAEKFIHILCDFRMKYGSRCTELGYLFWCLVVDVSFANIQGYIFRLHNLFNQRSTKFCLGRKSVPTLIPMTRRKSTVGFLRVSDWDSFHEFCRMKNFLVKHSWALLEVCLLFEFLWKTAIPVEKLKRFMNLHPDDLQCKFYTDERKHSNYFSCSSKLSETQKFILPRLLQFSKFNFIAPSPADLTRRI